MAAKIRTNAQIAHDRREIAHLYLNEKLSQAEIGGRLSMTQQMVSYDLCRLQEMWLKAALMDLTRAKSEELARIDRLECEYWDAWQRSQEDKETSIKETSKGLTDTGRAKIQEKAEGQVGNPAFLAGVQWCIEKRCRILFGSSLAARNERIRMGVGVRVQDDKQVEITLFGELSQLPSGKASAVWDHLLDAERLIAEDN